MADTGEDDWFSLGVGDIVVDSAADESRWPKGTANGGEMRHYGEKEVTFQQGESNGIVGLT